MLWAELRPLGACSEWRGSGLSGDAQWGCTGTKLTTKRGVWGGKGCEQQSEAGAKQHVQDQRCWWGETRAHAHRSCKKKNPRQWGAAARGGGRRISYQNKSSTATRTTKKKKKITNPTWLTHQQPCYKTSRGSISRSGS